MRYLQATALTTSTGSITAATGTTGTATATTTRATTTATGGTTAGSDTADTTMVEESEISSNSSKFKLTSGDGDLEPICVLTSAYR